ncbi:MAG: LacI family DNA-binding transcriptional regulator [Candidatus Omnitrophota bacterium]
MADQPTQHKMVGLLTAFTPEIFKSQYFNRIISGVIDALRNAAYDLKMIMVKDEEYADESRKILDEHRIDGLMLLTWRIHPKYISEAMEGSELPVVIINDYVPGLKANIVYAENRRGAEIAVRHLLNRGYRKVGILQGPDEASLDSRERYKTWLELIRKYDMQFDPAHYRKCEYFFEEDGYLKMLDIIQTCDKLPRAVLCFNDDIAIGAIKALRESGILCPEQVAVIGYDGIERGKYVTPTLTTVNQPLEQMGQEMVRIMIGLIEGRLKGPVQKAFAPEIIIRESC